jgi:tetratricopeptide (TPR) repeat protein
MATVATGIAERCGGDPVRAAEILERAVTVAQAGSFAAVATLATVVQGYAYLDAGDVDAAEAAAHRGAAIAGDLDLEPYAMAGVEVLAAQVLRARGAVDEALAVLERIDAAGEDASRAGGGSPSLLFPRRQVVAHHAGALLEAGRLEQADACIERALGVPAEDVRSSVVALRVLGAIRAAQGRVDESDEALTQALDLAREAGYGTETRLTEQARERLSLAR